MMKRVTFYLIWGAMGWSLIPGLCWGQELPPPLELTLDSLLAIPVETASKYLQKQTEAPAFSRASIQTGPNLPRAPVTTAISASKSNKSFTINARRRLKP